MTMGMNMPAVQSCMAYLENMLGKSLFLIQENRWIYCHYRVSWVISIPG